MKVNGKDAYYIIHDSNARQDPKVQALICEHGMRGYGMFWAIVEMLREQSDYKLERSEYVWLAIANQTLSERLDAETFVTDCTERFRLFEQNGTHFWSPSLARRMEHVDLKREKCRASGSIGGRKAKGKQTPSDRLAKRKRSTLSLSFTKETENVYNEYATTVKAARKTDAMRSIQKHIEEGRLDEITRAMRNYAAKVSRDKTEQKFRIAPNNFFGEAARWDEFKTAEQPQIPSVSKIRRAPWEDDE